MKRLLIMAVLLAAGCAAGSSSSAQEAAGDVTIVLGLTDGGATAEIGGAGGAISDGAGAGVRIPAGALSTNTLIGLATSETAPLSDLHPLSAAYDFSPADVTFQKPVTISLPLPDGTTEAVVYLSRPDGSGWDLVGGVIWDGSIKADVTRLGTAFAGEPITAR